MMKKYFFLLVLMAGLFALAYPYLLAKIPMPRVDVMMDLLAGVYLVIFGMYGLYAEWLWKKFRAQGKTENLCVEANYYVQKKGLLGKVLLFPFMKIKSRNSFIISFLGAFAWIVILLIVINVFNK